jgi:hypothetical protein
MTQLRVQRKPEPAPRLTPLLPPMAVVLAAGVATTLLLHNGHQTPIDLVKELRPTIQLPALSGVQLRFLRTQAFVVQGREWALADHPPVTDFSADEMVPIGESRGYPIMANRARGLQSLSAKAGPYDRPYLDLGRQRYMPLRWRQRP